jgi:signal peptidase I
LPGFQRPGYYFVLGDHRCIASDSRDFGPVGRKLIYGKAVFIYWPSKDAGVVRWGHPKVPKIPPGKPAKMN